MRAGRPAIALLAFLTLLSPGIARGQEGAGAALGAKAEEKASHKEEGSHDFAFVVVPGPVYNPSMGWGLVLIPMAMYDVDPSDKVSPGSTTAGFAMATTNGSWGFGLAQKLFLAQDTWRLKGGAGVVSINERFYGIGGDATGDYVDMTMEAVFATVEGLRKIMPNGYAGVNLAYRQSRFRGKDANADAVLDAAGLNRTWLHNLLPGLRFDYDTRDVQTAPQHGLLTELTVKGASEAIGSTNTYSRVSTIYSQFHALGGSGRHVLAWSIDAEGGFGDVPFDEYPDIGGSKALRGYIRGQFTDKNMLSAQLEWRWTFWGPLGMTAFGGAGKVFPAWDAFGPEPWLPSAGAGLRYLVIPARRMNARFDVAWGKEGATFYFSVGEAF